MGRCYGLPDARGKEGLGMVHTLASAAVSLPAALSSPDCRRRRQSARISNLAFKAPYFISLAELVIMFVTEIIGPRYRNT